MIEAAENLKISAQNLNSVLTQSLEKISATRKRTKKLKAVSILRRRRKKKEVKLEVPSVFKKSVRKIQTKLGGGTGNIFNSILGFVSLLLLGVALNNIDAIKEKLKKTKENLEEKLKPVIEIGKVIFEGVRGFISLFETKDREEEYQKLLKDIQSLEKIKKDFSEIFNSSEKLEKTYKEVESGRYGKKNNITLLREGSLSDGSTFTYDGDKKEYTVNNGILKKKLTFGEFFNKYADSDIQNIITRDDSNLKPGDFVIGGFETSMLDQNEISRSNEYLLNNNMIAYNGRDNGFLMDFDESLFAENFETYYYQEVRVDKGASV